MQANLPTTMQAVAASRYGTPDVLSINEVPVPTPGKGKVLIKVEASSLNALDWHFLTGTPYLIRLVNGFRRPRRKIPGADVAGVIAAIGPEVHDFSVGDAVFGECSGGGCSPYLVAKTKSIVPIPDGVSFEVAGATPVAGLTALQGLSTHGSVSRGDRVLINGAAGGVGTFAVQIAKALGAEVTAVCSTGNVEMVRRLGADEVIDYTVSDFVEESGRFDVMLDNVGNRTPAECISVMQPDGRYVAVSGPKDNPWLDPMAHVAKTALAFRRVKPSFHQFTASPNHTDLTFLGQLLASGQLIPEVQRTIGLDDVADGITEIGTGHTKAKIVVLPNQ